MEKQRILNSESITQLFGLNSDLYKESMSFLKNAATSENHYETNFKKWKKIFTRIYGGDLSSELFLKHTYFTLILKTLVFAKMGLINDLSFDEINSKIIDNNLKKYKLFEFDFFSWPPSNKELFMKINSEVINSVFAKQDIFSRLYQQIFVSEIRHKGGEFFSPPNLVQKMVDDFYYYGAKILDPSCGSGIFLVTIILRILNSESSLPSKFEAINNVYGFDVNPLAIITAKTSIFIQFLNYFNKVDKDFPSINIVLCDSLFLDDSKNRLDTDFNKLNNSFDLVIGNPPWLTYKDIFNKEYQIKIRELSEKLNIKPSSQYITHIELASLFFYAIPSSFLKIDGKIFFVMPKSVLNGDHCYKFRAFSIFGKNLEIWDFPKNYFFNVNHICLKAVYIREKNSISINKKYPIKTKLFNDELELQEETYYSSLKIGEDGTKLILSTKELRVLSPVEKSKYKKQFFQGATLVPRNLVFFQISKKKKENLIIESDSDIASRAKKNWEFSFHGKEIEQIFHFKTFLNIHLIPFHIKIFKNVFLPVNSELEYDLDFLQKHPKALNFYNEINKFYQDNKKKTSKIDTLHDNLNYWNKLQKQSNNKAYIVIYNASGSNLKAAVIDNENQKTIVGSENYYYSTDNEDEAYYLAAILNSPILSKNIKLIKSSRHIHKRPFLFPIPIYDKENLNHKRLSKKGKSSSVVVQEIFVNNPKITSDKVRIIINRKLLKIQELTKRIIFS
ncbi:MAG: HsdM family class I SAM-dependent methyltransferase [Promethearchaeota archaeon]|jgi:hypothetical protein